MGREVHGCIISHFPVVHHTYPACNLGANPQHSDLLEYDSCHELKRSLIPQENKLLAQQANKFFPVFIFSDSSLSRVYPLEQQTAAKLQLIPVQKS